MGYETKVGLVENGIPPGEGHVADHDLRKAFRNGNFPEQFAFSNIEPIGPTGPGPTSRSRTEVRRSGREKLAFVDQGGTWVLQHDAALALVQAATAVN